MKTKTLIITFALLTFAASTPAAAPLGNAFTYQGKLMTGGNPTTGVYDMKFTLYDTNLTGSVIAGPVTNAAVGVTNGYFAVLLDFGASFNGNARWLEIEVRTNGAVSFSILYPRQVITPAPYAVYAPTAGSATNATVAAVANIANSVAAANVTGTLAPAQLPGGIVTNNATSVTLSGTFNGSGAGLTSVNADQVDGQHGAFYQNAANLTSGTVADARLSTNVPFLNSNLVFLASNRFAGVVVMTNTANTLAGAFMGNGSGITNLNASQLSSGAVPLSLLPGAVVTNNETGLNLSGTFSGNGAGVTNVNLMGVNDQGAISWKTNWGGFPLSSSTGLGVFPYSILAADVNGDNKPDLVTVNYLANSVTVLTNNGAGGFVARPSIAVGSLPMTGAAADINGDGAVDLITANSSDSTLTVLTNNGSGGFVQKITLALGGTSVAAADVNGDGTIDLLASRQTANSVTVLLNDGSGTFTYNATLNVGTRPERVIAADVNGDGRVDVITANWTSLNLTVMTNNGSGVFTLASSPSGGLNGPECVAAADFNGDGKTDLVVANRTGNSVTIFTNNGVGTFTLSCSRSVGSDPVWVTCGDVNVDGKTDVITADNAGQDLTVLTNNGTGIFTTACSVTAGTQMTGVVAIDLNGDGKIDLASSDGSGNAVSIFLNSPGSYSASFQGDYAGNGSGITGLNASQITAGTLSSALLPDSVVTNNDTGVSLSGIFSGNGTSLTNLNAASLTGTVADGRLSTNVALRNAANVFTATNVFSRIGIGATNPATALDVNGTVTATNFAGNAAGLYNQVCSANYLHSYSTITQAVAVAETFQDITCDTDAAINGWTHTLNTATFTNTQAGLYLITYNAEAMTTATASSIVSLRATLNGAEIAGSASAANVNTANVVVPVSKTFLASITSGGLVKFQMTGSSTTDRLVSNAGSASLRPSFSCTITRLQ